MLKIKQLYILLTFVFATILSCSNSPNTIHKDSATQDEIEKEGNSVLWKIEKEGHKTSYIFGTMHMIEPEYYELTSHLTQIIKNSDAIVMEIGGQPNPLEAFNLMQLQNGSVEDFFTEDQLKKLLQFMDTKLNISPKQFRATYSKMKPFFILQTISQAFFSENAESYDLNIMQLAKEYDKPLLGFETMEEQLAMFEKIPSKDMALMIMNSVENFDKEKKNTTKLQKLYAKQKVDKLIPIMKSQSPEFMAYEDLFLTNRNKNWIPKITDYTEKQSCFIAVGAAHLFGTNGVLALLQEQGFKTQAVKK